MMTPTHHQLPMLTRTKEYTRIRDLPQIPQKLRTVDPSMFVETVDGLPLGRGVTIAYTITSLESLVNCDFAKNTLRTARVTSQELAALTRHGLQPTQKGQVKEWRDNES